MALNKNHEFEELNGVKCGIVEKNSGEERLAFLKELLEYNGYTVVAIPSPAPKAPVKTADITTGAETAAVEEPLTPATYTIGVTDYTFNPVNAIFGRLLKTKEGGFVTLAYWNQQENTSDDTIPYFENKNTWK